MLNSIRPKVAELTHHFELCNGHWQEGALRFATTSAPAVLVRRILSGSDSFLWDRDGWEAEFRKCDGPYCDYVIQQMAKARQTVSIVPTHSTLGPFKLAKICEQLCGYVARETDGLIQVYQEGFFNAEGESLLPYCPQTRLKTS